MGRLKRSKKRDHVRRDRRDIALARPELRAPDDSCVYAASSGATSPPIKQRSAEDQALIEAALRNRSKNGL